MTYKPEISLVIVSRDRPKGLHLLIKALEFQTYRNFEVIVVTDGKNQFSDRIKYIEFNQANISMARNLGIQAASAELIAFCDDDAIPEPTWLERLTIAFNDPDVGIAGGFVRGRNGIDFQWKAQKVNQYGFDQPLALEDDTKPQTFGEKDGWLPKVQGTNCMFRKEVLQKLGGFDENFEFYLDETDVCTRASLSGWKTAIVPDAEVQHGFEQSTRRTPDRVPRSLFAEGSSKAYFCKKHGGGSDCSAAIEAFRAEQRSRLIRLMISGHLMPAEVKKLLATLETGLIKGETLTPVTSKPQMRWDVNGFKRFFTKDSANYMAEIFAGSTISKRPLVKAAISASEKGIAATVFCWSFTALFHRRYFDERGFWAQTGGLFGKSVRKDAYFQFITVAGRSKKEAAKLKDMRKISKISIFRFKKLASVIK
jgi:GT2 family glycosyltransferase